MATPWGTLPVVGIEDLVELKKTNRPSDYEVITRLAFIRLRREARPSLRLLHWAIENIFRVEDLWLFVNHFGIQRRMKLPQTTKILHRIWSLGRDPRPAELSRVASLLARRAQSLQNRGRNYWLPRIAELRQMRKAGMLLEEGQPVQHLLTRFE
jgi:hypothetical protein